MLSDFTPDIVLSGFVDSLVMSFGGNISTLLGCAMRVPAWLARSRPCGFDNSFFRWFSSFFFFGGLLGGEVFSGPIAPPLRVFFFVFFPLPNFSLLWLSSCWILSDSCLASFTREFVRFFLDLCFLHLLRNISNNLLSSSSLSSLVVASLSLGMSRNLCFVDILP